MLKLRTELGPGAIAHLILRKMEKDTNRKIVIIDGIRSMPEVDILKSVGYVKLLVSTHQQIRGSYIQKKELDLILPQVFKILSSETSGN